MPQTVYMTHRRTTGREAIGLAVAIMAGLVLVAAALVLTRPRTDPDPAESAAEAAAFEAGRQVGRAELEQVVGDAYAQGRRDALADIHQGPQRSDAPRARAEVAL
jgi:hypothetical protein